MKNAKSIKDIKQKMSLIAQQAKKASALLPVVPSEIKNKAIIAMAQGLVSNSQTLIRANQLDLNAARSCGRKTAFMDRLVLNKSGIVQMSDSLSAIASLADPVGQLICSWRRPNGLLIKKVRVPIGVIAIVYEARPNVTSDCAGLCLKSGNAVILRGGKEAIHSNLAIFNILRSCLVKYKLPAEAISLIKDLDHKAIDALLSLSDSIDLVIPRGGEGLIKLVSQKSKIAVIKHYKGICHTYVDKDADLAMASKVVFNAKVQRPGVCNAMETLLVHQGIAQRFLPSIIRVLQEAGVEIRADQATRRIVKGLKKATEADWSCEYLDLILAVKVVKDTEQAIAHITKYGSRHSDAIITKNQKNAEKFLNQVDSACVYLNASTRFTDGYEFGLGAEMGISTDKLHARGPMALEELTTYKYQILGRGQIRS